MSSDDIRAGETQRIFAQGKFNKDQSFERSRKAANNKYKAKFIEIINETANLKPNCVHVVFLDKNHPPNGGIEAATDIIDSNMPAGVEYQKLYLHPEVKNAKV